VVGNKKARSNMGFFLEHRDLPRRVAVLVDECKSALSFLRAIYVDLPEPNAPIAFTSPNPNGLLKS
jgi:hypothetical protein